MTAFEIVDLLLEADQYNSGVYIFGPEMPVEGYAASSVEKAIEAFRRRGLIDPQTRDDAGLMDQLVGAGYTFLLKKHPGEVEVVGKVPVQTTPEGQEQAAQYLGLERHAKVQYRSSIRGNSQEMDAAYVLHGSKELEQERSRNVQFGPSNQTSVIQRKPPSKRRLLRRFRLVSRLTFNQKTAST